MSGDDHDDLEGSDEQSVGEHFAPVWNSLRRTVTSRWVQVYTVSFIGIVILSASLGGVVLGTYATVQPDYGLCERPAIVVSSAENTEDLIAGPDAPDFTRLEYDELSGEEQDAFREALRVPNQDAEIEPESEHIEEFQQGVVVSYRGESHYVVIETMDNCVPTGFFNIPLSVVGLVVGSVLFVSPSLWRWRRGSNE